MTEKELQHKIGNYLSQYFKIEYEVWSTDMKKRIDIVAVHKNDLEKKYPFGIEVKINDTKKGGKLAEWVKQCNIYSSKDFINYGKIIILAYPPIQLNYFREGFDVNNHENGELVNNKRIHAINKENACYHEHNNVSTFLGQFGIGEVIKKKHRVDYIEFIHTAKILYNTKENKIRFDNYNKIAAKCK